MDQAVIRATIHRLVEDGYAGMSLAKVAAEAGTSRPTVYLRWPTKRALVVDAVRSTLGRDADVGPQRWGDLPAQERLLRLLQELRPAGDGEHRQLYATLMAESYRIAELRDLLNEEVVEPRVRAITAMLEAMQERGEVRPGVNLGHAATMLYGVRFVDSLRTGGVSTDLDRESVELLWPSIGTNST